jgi:hypothetical protein
MRKLISLTLALLVISPMNSAHADVLTLNSYDYVSVSDIWSVEFSPDGSMLYFAENGSNDGLRRISTTNFLANLAPVDTATDGYNTFRSTHPSWQISDLEVTSAPGKGGHSWVYATAGNLEEDVTPADSLSHTTASIVWAIDRTTNQVEWMPTKRASGIWQIDGMYALTKTPDDRYVYAFGYGNGYESGAELFKYSTATNTQVGRGIPIDGSFPVADNTNVYYLSGTGLYKSVIDGNNSSNNGDSAPTAMNINWTNTAYNFTDWSSLSLVNGELYLTSSTNDVIGVVDPVSLKGTTYTIANTSANKITYSLRMGVDGCVYTIQTDPTWTYYSVNKINLTTSTVIATTGNVATFWPYWEDAVSMNAAGTLLVISPSNRDNASIKYIPISGSACGGVALHSGATGGGGNNNNNQNNNNIDYDALKKAAEQKRLEAVKQAKDVVNKKLASGGAITAKDLADAEMGAPSEAATNEINKVLANLPAESRTDIQQVNKVISKYLLLDNLTSRQVTTVSAQQLVAAGILSESTPCKSLILQTIKNANPSSRDSFEKINEIIKNQVAIFNSRKAKLAEVLARYK